VGCRCRGDLWPPTTRLRSGAMRDWEVIDSELRLLPAVRRMCREEGGTVASRLVARSTNCPMSA
jgi:hypothetical protein